MKKYSLLINPLAERDLQIAADWYNEQKDGLDRDFIDEVEKTIFRIHQNPNQFGTVQNKTRMAIVKRFPYGIYFYIANENINVFAVFHFSRNPKRLRRRIK